MGVRFGFPGGTLALASGGRYYAGSRDPSP